MKRVFSIVACLMVFPTVVATHSTGCPWTAADPASYLVIDTPDGNRYYWEERGNPFGTPLVVGGAILFGPDADGDGVPEFFGGQGSFMYMESNGIDGLQRDVDETCGHGSDFQLFPPGPSGVPRVELEEGSTILPVSLNGLASQQVGCFGLVQVGVASASLPVVGVRLLSDPCTVSNPPCEIYRSAGLTCVANPAACCFPIFAFVPSAPNDVACVRSALLKVDVNGDGFWDVVLPVATVTAPPC